MATAKDLKGKVKANPPATAKKKTTTTAKDLKGKVTANPPSYKAPDYTQQKQATTQQDVSRQNREAQLWQSLDYSYGAQRRNSDKQFAEAYSQADRQATSRGMGRSSYNNQTLANINQRKIEAQDDIYAAQIADYQNRLLQLEQQDREEAWREREFQASREDADWNKRFQQGQLDYQKERDTRQFDYQKERDAKSDSNWEKQFAASREDTAWQQAFQQGQFDYQKTRDTVGDKRYDEQLAYQKERDTKADEQWEKQFTASREDQKWQQEYMQDEFKYKYGLAGGGAGGAGGGGYGGSSYNPGSYNPGTTTTETEADPIEEAKKLKSAVDKYQQDGQKRTAQIKAQQAIDAGKKAQADGLKRTEQLQRQAAEEAERKRKAAEAAVAKYQRDGWTKQAYYTS